MPVNDFNRHPLSWQPDPGLLSRPRYMSLAALLETDISEGRLPPGTRLPPQRELADWLDLNFTTVTRAYELCREKGLVYGVTGRGTFVTHQPAVDAGGADDVIDLGAVQGFPQVGADRIVAAARTVLSRDYVTQLFSYGERSGTPRHRSAGAYWLKRFGAEASSAQIAVFAGVQSAIVTLLLTMFHPGDTLAVDEFTYANLIAASRLAHVKLAPVAGDQYGMLPSALDEVAAKCRPRGVFLMPTCANPTTITLSSRRRNDLAKTIKRYGMLVLEDDASLEPSSRGSMFALLPEQTFYLSGNTRHISPGLRIAFLAFPMQYRDRILAAQHHLTIKTNALDAELMSELILDGLADDILAQKIALARRMNRVFQSVFPENRRKAEDVPLFRTIPLPGTLRANGPDVERALRDRGVQVCHSDRFAVTQAPHRRFLRLSISSTAGENEFRKGLSIVRDWSNMG